MPEAATYDNSNNHSMSKKTRIAATHGAAHRTSGIPQYSLGNSIAIQGFAAKRMATKAHASKLQSNS